MQSFVLNEKLNYYYGINPLNQINKIAQINCKWYLLILAIQTLKDPYIFDFLTLSKQYKEKDIIKSIRDYERKHNQILRRLYYEFTGQILPVDILSNEQKNNKDYKTNLEKALFDELEAVTKYRRILGTMPSGNSYTLLMSIMTDELIHASKYNFLIQKAK